MKYFHTLLRYLNNCLKVLTKLKGVFNSLKHQERIMTTKSKKTFKFCTRFCLLFTALSSTTFASSIYVSPQISTLGAGLSLGYQINASWNVRTNINGLGVHHTFHDSQIDYASKINLRTAGLLIDYFPFENGFHLTAGAYYNDNRIDGDSIFTQNYSMNVGHKTIKINPNDYGSMRFKARYNHFSPYLGMGYHAYREKGWGFDINVGVLYQGNAHVDYDISAMFEAIPSMCSPINENKQRIQNQVNNLKWYPVASIGVIYKF